METINILLLVFLIISVLLIVTFVILLNKFKDKSDDLSFLNSYPFEYFMSMSDIQRRVLYSLFFINIFIQICLTFISLFQLGTIYLTIIAFLSTIAFILFSVGFITPLTYFKQHLICIISSFFLYMSYNVLLSFYKLINESNNFNLSILIVIGILGFISLFSFINPNLLKWSSLNKGEENGKTIYIKPKVNSLPLYEWIYLLLFQFSTILISINGIINIK